VQRPNPLPWFVAPALIALAAGCSDSSRASASTDFTDPFGPSGLIASDGTAEPNGPADPADPAKRPRILGGPIDGLSASQLAAFERGKEVFERRFLGSEGLGPLYNAQACVSCHSQPVTGGSSRVYRNFYIAAIDFGGPQSPVFGLPSVVIPSFGGPPHITAQFSLEEGRQVIPATQAGFPVVVAQRNAIPIFGTGLFSFIHDSTILANADPNDTITPDGISGRANVDTSASPTAIGRFGVKSQSNAIEFFTRGPLQNQMGITTNPFLGSGAIVSLCSPAAAYQAGSGADVPTSDGDAVPDPELLTPDLADLIAFSMFLAPPEPLPFDAAATAGQARFDQIGCTKCHLPTLASDLGPVQAYTDLLLHEMGPGLADGINFGLPQPSSISLPISALEFRTQPLWGVSLHAPFLHDGRAETLEEAILEHGGEAQAIRDAFAALPQNEKDEILAFLEHL